MYARDAGRKQPDPRSGEQAPRSQESEAQVRRGKSPPRSEPAYGVFSATPSAGVLPPQRPRLLRRRCLRPLGCRTLAVFPRSLFPYSRAVQPEAVNALRAHERAARQGSAAGFYQRPGIAGTRAW
ncbi:MAG: hypothetical protein MdMp014T_2414 [Treponematales bacterium]